MTVHITSNLAKENNHAQVLSDCRKIAGEFHGRPVLWRVQECETWGHVLALLTIAQEQNLGIYWPGGRPKAHRKPSAANAIPILYSQADFTFVSGRRRRVLTALFHGWPTRYVARLIVTAKATGKNEAAVGTHAIQQAFTSHPERRGKWNASMRKVVRMTRATSRVVHRTVGGGDLNRNRYRVPGARMMYAAHGTHGSAYYDALWLMGDGDVGNVWRLALKSDHDALLAVIL